MRRLACALVALGALWLSAHSARAEALQIPVVVYTLKGEKSLNLEIATTPQTRSTGLMNRNSLDDNDGMLFVFPTPSDTAFWMKDTLIPLDMLFIDENYRIIHIEHHARPHTLTPRHAKHPISAAIEIMGNRASELGIAVGDRVRYTLPKNLQVK